MLLKHNVFLHHYECEILPETVFCLSRAVVTKENLGISIFGT